MNLFNLYAKIGLDTKEYEKGVQSAKKSAHELKLEAMNLAKKQEVESKKTSKSWKIAVTDIGKSLDGLKKGFSVAAKGITIATTVATSALVAFATVGISYNATMEQFQTAFTTMLGSSESADKLTESLKNFAAATPLAMSDLAGATKTLLAFGSSAEDIPDQLKRLGDVAQGDAQALGTMATAFGRIQSNGKASLEEINMMIDQGFNPLTIIAKKTGESMEEVRKRVSDGGVSFEELSDALRTATSEGGQFFNAMENQSRTIKGRISTLKDNAMALAGALSKDLTAGFGELIETAIGWIDKLSQAMGDKGITGVIETAGEILSQATIMLADAAPKFVEQGFLLVQSFAKAVVEALPQVVESGVKVVRSILNGISDMLPTAGEETATIITTITDAIFELLPEILMTGSKILFVLVDGIIASFPKLIDGALKSVSALIDTILNNLPQILDTGSKMLISLIDGIVAKVPDLLTAAGELVIKMLIAIIDNLPKFLVAGGKILGALLEGVLNLFGEIDVVFGKFVESIIKIIIETDWLKVGSDIIQGLIDGILAVWDRFTNWFNNLWDGVFGKKTINVDINTTETRTVKTVSEPASGGGGKNPARPRMAVDGSHRTGLNFVPFDGYIAELHKGERVLTREENENLNKKTGGVTVVQNIYSQAKTAAELMIEAQNAQRRAVLMGV